MLLDAEPGSIVAFGQKDNRGNGTYKALYLVGEDGSLEKVSESEARDHAAAKDSVKIDPQNELAAERKMLVARISEIDSERAILIARIAEIDA